jgi:clan AA aspartic protease
MITGTVRFSEARIRLAIRGRKGQEIEFEAIIDSGYTGTLTLPPALITSLGLRWQSDDRAILANGSTCLFRVFVGKLLWDGKERFVLVDEASVDPLVGMRLLKGHEMKMQVRNRGKVTIRRLPPT